MRIQLFRISKKISGVTNLLIFISIFISSPTFAQYQPNGGSSVPNFQKKQTLVFHTGTKNNIPQVKLLIVDEDKGKVEMYEVGWQKKPISIKYFEKCEIKKIEDADNYIIKQIDLDAVMSCSIINNEVYCNNFEFELNPSSLSLLEYIFEINNLKYKEYFEIDPKSRTEYKYFNWISWNADSINKYTETEIKFILSNSYFNGLSIDLDSDKKLVNSINIKNSIIRNFRMGNFNSHYQPTLINKDIHINNCLLDMVNINSILFKNKMDINYYNLYPLSQVFIRFCHFDSSSDVHIKNNTSYIYHSNSILVDCIVFKMPEIDNAQLSLVNNRFIKFADFSNLSNKCIFTNNSFVDGISLPKSNNIKLKNNIFFNLISIPNFLSDNCKLSFNEEFFSENIIMNIPLQISPSILSLPIEQIPKIDINYTLIQFQGNSSTFQTLHFPLINKEIRFDFSINELNFSTIEKYTSDWLKYIDDSKFGNLKSKELAKSKILFTLELHKIALLKKRQGFINGINYFYKILLLYAVNLGYDGISNWIISSLVIICLLSLFFTLFYFDFIHKYFNSEGINFSNSDLLNRSKRNITPLKFIIQSNKIKTKIELLKYLIKTYMASFWFTMGLFLNPKLNIKFFRFNSSLFVLIIFTWMIGIFWLYLFVNYIAANFEFVKFLF